MFARSVVTQELTPHVIKTLYPNCHVAIRSDDGDFREQKSSSSHHGLFRRQIFLGSASLFRIGRHLKPRYYPHLTILAAVLLTVVPLGLVLWISSERSDSGQLADSETFRDRSEWDAQIDATVNGQSDNGPPDNSADQSHSAATIASGPARSSNTAVAHDAAVNDVKLAVAGVDGRSAVSAQVRDTVDKPDVPVTPRIAQPETRVAMRNDRLNRRDAPSTFSSVEDELDDLAMVPEPPVRPAKAGTVSAAGDVAADDMNHSKERALVEQQRNELRAQQMEMERLNREMQHAMTAPPQRQTQTWYDATGHLAMRTPSVKPPNAADGDEKDKEKKKSSKRRPRLADKTDLDNRREMAGSTDVKELETWLDPESSESELPEVLEDVILQQPLESRNVSQVENVVAVTRAKGWPIAMVRSDIPDDDWWVQQMVGIRGNAFAARVNFGNENSIPGSVYHMVIMFLDSPDEVRRFRIAKQFEKLPEGVRRSREFTFVRQ